MFDNHCIGDGDKKDADDKDYVEDHLGQDSKNSKAILLDILLDYTIYDRIRQSNIIISYCATLLTAVSKSPYFWLKWTKWISEAKACNNADNNVVEDVCGVEKGWHGA